ncbi:MAG: right-handed parallel beta-helix repeat-containing protein, partial [Spirochaetales bacterium]|nr:right-handed parallel beta-helix repeat-containing protein [Spirochaetales bacterium]
SGYICVLNVDSATEVAYNRLIAVEDSNTAGVYNIGSSPVIYNNVIDGGGDELVMANSYGIVNESGSAPVIANNTICAGRGLIGTYGIYLKESPGTVIENNIIFTDDGTYRFGVYVWNTGNPVSLRNNNIFDFVVPYHCGNDGRIIEVTDIHQMNALSGFQVSGNISSPPVFSDREAMDVRITEESGANTRAGGLDLSGYLLDDIDGNPRTGGYGGDASSIRPNNEGAAGWSIGAYECDG